MNEAAPLRNRLSRFVSNAASLFTSEVLNKATTFVVYAMVSRYLDPHAFGQLSLGLLLFYTFQVLATAGMPTLITREVAKLPRRTRSFLINGCAAAVVSATCAMLVMIGLALIMRYDRGTTLMIATLSLGLLPFGLALVIESIFRGREKMHLIAAANVPANVAKVVGAFILLSQGFGVLSIGLLLVGVRVAIVLVEWTCVTWLIDAGRGRFRPALALALFKRSATFFGVDSVTAIWTSVNAVLLSKFATEVEVGLYGAACQLLQPFLLVYRSVAGSVFPSMCQRAARGIPMLADMTRSLVTFLLTLGLPAALIVFYLADVGLWMLYGDEFGRATPVLQVLSGMLVLQCFTNVMGHALWAAGKERVALRIVTVNLILNIAIGLVAIGRFGLMGAAYTMLAIECFNVLQHYLACRRSLSMQPVGSTVFKPLAAVALMGGCLLVLNSTDRYVAAAIGAAAYTAAVGLFMLRWHGGWRGIRGHYTASFLDS